MKCESPGVLLLCLNLDRGLTDWRSGTQSQLPPPPQSLGRSHVLGATAVALSPSLRYCGGDTLLRKRRTTV